MSGSPAGSRPPGAELWATRTAWLTARMLTLDVQPLPKPRDAGVLVRGAGMTRRCWTPGVRGAAVQLRRQVAPMLLGFRRIAQGDDSSPAGGAGGWRSATGTHRSRRRSGASVTTSCSSATRSCPASPPNLGVYATEPEADPVGDWLASCARLATLAEERHLALPGHRRPFRGLPARLEELIRHQKAALAALQSSIWATPRRASECFAPLYGRPIGERRVRAGAGRGGGRSQPPRPRRRDGAQHRDRTAPGCGAAAKNGA